MFYKNKYIALLLSLILFLTTVNAKEIGTLNDSSENIQAIETTQESKYPDYAKMYAGNDKYEKFNRKIFNLNSKLNRYVARPAHILWSSIMPKFGIDRIRDAYNNIEYPKRLASCILQRDGQGIKIETLRFITNTTLGLGGLFDPADKILKIKPTNENMEQALCKCNVKSGSYLVMPVLNSCTPRSLCGRTIEAALDPCLYLATPITSVIKFGLMLNKTSYMQPLAKMIESTYADPYDIHKKLYGMENYIRNQNLDREELLIEEKMLAEQGDVKDAESLIAGIGDKPAKVEQENENTEFANNINNEPKNLKDIIPLGENAIKADLILNNYNSQTPVVDSMRTVLFENPDINKSMWNELSIWNRSFARRIKTGQVEITEGKPEYSFKYILQKDKNAPLFIIYPSIGEGAGTHHSVVFAKIFYDAGYSVIMLGSHFHWEFVKSMPDGYYPGLPDTDAKYIRSVTAKIVDNIEKKYEHKFSQKNILGTSLGAMSTLFIANLESNDNILNINKYIAVSPPIDLKYALTQIDKNSDEFDKTSDEVKQKTATTAAKILQLYQLKNDGDLNIETLPFSDEEGKLITTFIMRQKLSDLIFTIEKAPNNKKTNIYEVINNMSYKDYAEKYLGITNWFDENILDEKNTSLYSLANYFLNNDNYKIYQSLDDYLINKSQLAKLKNYAGTHMTCLNCGAHLGFLYRKEFTEALMKDINNKS